MWDTSVLCESPSNLADFSPFVGFISFVCDTSSTNLQRTYYGLPYINSPSSILRSQHPIEIVVNLTSCVRIGVPSQCVVILLIQAGSTDAYFFTRLFRTFIQWVLAVVVSRRLLRQQLAADGNLHRRSSTSFLAGEVLLQRLIDLE